MVSEMKNGVTDFGGDGPIVVLLHGFLSSSRYWSRVQPLLSAAGCRVIAVDLLGFGKALKPHDSEYSYDAHIAYIREMLATLHITQPFNLVGHSMGGLLAARLARDYADEVKTLALLHPPLYKDTLEVRSTLRGTGVHYRFLLDSRFRRIGWKLVQTTSPTIARHADAAREGSMKRVIEPAEIFEDLSLLTMPTFLLVGTRDRHTYVKNLDGRVMNKRIQIVIENLTHHSPRREPEYVARMILELIQNAGQ